MEYTKKNGAKEGLKQKMNYWHEKDYQYEFGVTVGQAINNLFTSQPQALQDGSANYLVELLKIFEVNLLAKQDPRFIAMFNEYYANKQKGPKEIAVEVV